MEFAQKVGCSNFWKLFTMHLWRYNWFWIFELFSRNVSSAEILCSCSKQVWGMATQIFKKAKKITSKIQRIVGLAWFPHHQPHLFKVVAVLKNQAVATTTLGRRMYRWNETAPPESPKSYPLNCTWLPGDCVGWKHPKYPAITHETVTVVLHETNWKFMAEDGMSCDISFSETQEQISARTGITRLFADGKRAPSGSVERTILLARDCIHYIQCM